MKRSLQGKLILSFLAVALITVVVVSALIWLTSGQALMNLVVDQRTAQMQQDLQDFYISNGTLDGFFNGFVPADKKSAPSQPGNPNRPPHFRGVDGVVDADYRAVLPTLGFAVGQQVPANRITQAIPVVVDGKTIAWVLPDTGFQFQLSAEEQVYLQRSGMIIGLAALTGVAAALTIGFLLSSGLLRPIRRLTQASQALARGNLNQQLPVTSEDELGQLTATFNQMSAELARADEQRKRLTADVAHDLATPLQVISGYIDMLDEGDVTLTPARIDILRTELGHLRRLVSDLGILTQVEAGGVDIQMQAVSPSALLRHIGQTFEPIASRRGVHVIVDAPERVPAIHADEGRMMQVLRNLVENALRHTPDGGKIELGANERGEEVELRVTDTGDGIDAGDLPFVFDRFYRADKARGGNAGKMGLGLAICKALVQVQGGSIMAVSAGKGRGASIVMRFSRAKAEAAV